MTMKQLELLLLNNNIKIKTWYGRYKSNRKVLKLISKEWDSIDEEDQKDISRIMGLKNQSEFEVCMNNINTN